MSLRESETQIRQQNTTPDKQVKILFIDDDTYLIGLIKEEFIEAKNWETFFSSNAKKGLKKAKEIQPDLIVLDLLVNGLNGYDLIKEIKNDSVLRRSDLLVMSKKLNEREISSLRELGVSDMLAKPFRFSELKFRLENLLNNHSYVQRTS